jgi:hypothetical protein
VAGRTTLRRVSVVDDMSGSQLRARKVAPARVAAAKARQMKSVIRSDVKTFYGEQGPVPS